MDLLINLLALILVLVAVTHVSSNVICGASDDYLPNPVDCGSFYQCSNGDAILMPCPAVLVFDPNLNVCVRPNEYNCQSATMVEPSTTTIITESTTITMETTEATLKEQYCQNSYVPEITRCVSNTIYVPDLYDCRLYYLCILGTQSRYVCEDSKVWDATLKTCVDPTRYNCAARICQTKTEADACLYSTSSYTTCSFCFDTNFNNGSRCDDNDNLINAGCQSILNCST